MLYYTVHPRLNSNSVFLKTDMTLVEEESVLDSSSLHVNFLLKDYLLSSPRINAFRFDHFKISPIPYKHRFTVHVNYEIMKH